MYCKKISKLVHMLLTFITLLFVLSGLGISDYRLIESITLGILTKERSFMIHSNLIEVFAVLLLLHVYLKVWVEVKK